MFYIPATIKTFQLFIEQEKALWEEVWANFPQSVDEFNNLYESSFTRKNESGEVFVLKNKEASHAIPSAIIMPRRYYEEEHWVPYRQKRGEYSPEDWGMVIMDEGGRFLKKDEYNNDLEPIFIECSSRSEYHKEFTSDKWREGDNILFRTEPIMYPINFMEEVIKEGWNKNNLRTILLEGKPCVATWNVEKIITGRDGWTGNIETRTKRTWYTLHMQRGIKIEDHLFEVYTSNRCLYISCLELGINDKVY